MKTNDVRMTPEFGQYLQWCDLELDCKLWRAHEIKVIDAYTYYLNCDWIEGAKFNEEDFRDLIEDSDRYYVVHDRVIFQPKYGYHHIAMREGRD